MSKEATITGAIHRARTLLEEVESTLDDIIDIDETVDAAVESISEIAAKIGDQIDAIAEASHVENDPAEDLLDALLEVHQVAVLAVESGSLEELAEVLRDDCLRVALNRRHQAQEAAT